MKTPCTLYNFLQATGGNWRNAVFVACDACPFGKPACADGFLLTADSYARPILLPAAAIYSLSGIQADPAECLAVISRRQFETVYAQWLLWQVDAADTCALRAAASTGLDTACRCLA